MNGLLQSLCARRQASLFGKLEGEVRRALKNEAERLEAFVA